MISLAFNSVLLIYKTGIKDKFKIPVFAYQVSGEYSIIKNGINNKIIGEDSIIESLTAFKRAGASAIVTYFAEEIAKKLR